MRKMLGITGEEEEQPAKRSAAIGKMVSIQEWERIGTLSKGKAILTE
jgi:hypothetical protein